MTDEKTFNADFKTIRALPQSFQWENEPRNWSMGPGGLKVIPEAKTDLWQRTHYGIQNDNGHFLSMPVEEKNFILQTRVRYLGKNEFDQAGLLIRISPMNWIKTSVEYQTEGNDKLGAVVTNLGFSDWSCQDFENPSNDVILRIRAERPDYLIEYRVPGTPAKWTLIRIAHLHTDHIEMPLHAGIYCCSPIDDGFRAEFDYLELERIPD